MEIEFTEGSAREYESIVYGRMTPQVAAAYLRAKPAAARGFGETLRRLYPADDLLPRLQAAFLARDPAANRRSLTKRLQNWLADRNLPTSREDLFLVAFALGLTEDQLGHLLGLCTGYAVQYRDGQELVLAWFLRNGRSYEEACAFLATLPPYEPHDALDVSQHTRLTHELEATFAAVATTEGLRRAYEASLDKFGSQHLRAYFYFDRYLTRLIAPEPAFPGDEAEPYSIEAVTDTYLSLAMPSGRSRQHLGLVQRLIKQNWPNTTAVKNIRNHVEDVPRKLLLLLYVVTENVGFDDGADDFFPEVEPSFEDRVRDHWHKLGAMLADCGMAPLDLRNAFDWLVLYAIAAPDDDSAMSDRMEQVIALLYG